MNCVVFEDEITLYWDKEWELGHEPHYRIQVNGNTVATTTKTYYSLFDLFPKTKYDIRITALDGNSERTFYAKTITTKPTQNRIDVTKAPYFAKGDGVTLNTEALQRALNDCTDNDVVYFPAGIFLTGALNVHDNTQIYVEKGATIQGSSRVEDYMPKIKSRFEGTEMMCYRSLLNLGTLDRNGDYNCKNIVIRGQGKIFGGGVALANATIDYESVLLKEFFEKNPEYVKTCDRPQTLPGRARGRLINMSNCENVVLSGLHVGYAAAWNIHFIYCKNIITYNCFIQSNTVFDENGNVKTQGVWNGDGWDPDSSENCVLFNTVFDTYDDGVAIKSGKNPEGNIINRPTKDVRIFDCRGSHGVAIGSELSGGIENIYIWDSHFSSTNGGRNFRIKTTKKRGGYVKNIKIKNCSFGDIRIWSGYACNDDGEGANTLTELKNFTFDCIHVTGAIHHQSSDDTFWRFDPIIFVGFKEQPIENISLKNITIGRFETSYERQSIMHEYTFDTSYPQPLNYPVDGYTQRIHVKHVKNLSIENLSQEE